MAKFQGKSHGLKKGCVMGPITKTLDQAKKSTNPVNTIKRG